MNFNFLVLGDSVAWGQGLPDEQKFYRLLSSRIQARHSDWQVAPILLAHSGATIVMQGEEPAEIAGEVPVAYPSLDKQARQTAVPPADVRLVVLNGGINDIDVRFILNPFTSTFDLTDQIALHCRKGMADLLRSIASLYPSAVVILTGYYPILSRQSSLPWIPKFLDIHGIAMPSMVSSDIVLGNVIHNCIRFWVESRQAFKDSVEEASLAFPFSKLFYVDAGYGEGNAVFGPQARLFGLTDTLEPQDLLAAQRHSACDRYIDQSNILGREQCYRASAGHPTADGHVMYANAIDLVLQQNGI